MVELLDDEITEVDEIDALDCSGYILMCEARNGLLATVLAPIAAVENHWQHLRKRELRHETSQNLNATQRLLNRAITARAASERQKPVREERFIMNPTNGGDVLKCVVTLSGNRVTAADVTFRTATNKNPNQMIKFGIPPEAPYQLQQLQDAVNAVAEAMIHLSTQDQDYEFQTAEEVIKILQPVIAHLSSARTTLIIPKKRSFEELKASLHRRHFVPPLPADMCASFYLQAHKMIFALYQLLPVVGKFDCFQAEVSVPWLTESLVLLTVALQTCQQLLDKMNIFTQNLDLSPKPFD